MPVVARAPQQAPIPAAQYLRMSTEHQRYSPELQAMAIAAYALENGYEIVETYRDDGVSGLSIKGREGLKRLLEVVLAGEPAFQVILVYDVSRWGRFQNPDQSAHYEFLCAEAGVRVEYCAERFANDGSSTSAILKTLKRVMAAEYSRDLSNKVAAAQRRHAANGYWQGGGPGYGLRRQTVDELGRPCVTLEVGEYKAIQSHRTVLVPGPESEIKTVRWIYRAFVKRTSRCAIARALNAKGIAAEGGAPWTERRVNQILTNPKYMGALASQKSACELGGTRQGRPKSTWVIAHQAIEPLIDLRLFKRVQTIIALRAHAMDDTAMLQALRALHDRHGYISARLVRAAPGMFGPQAYVRRFGSLRAACAACDRPMPGFAKVRLHWADRDDVMRLLAQLYQRTGHLSCRTINAEPDLPHATSYRRLCGSMANAYAEVGFAPLTKRGQASLVAPARAEAASLRLQRALRPRP